MEIEDTPSPNFDDRKHPVTLLVLHYTGMESGEAALTRMRDPEAKVSAHYMVWEDGRIARLVAENDRAWHAGVSTWQSLEDLNSRSVGIEIVNGGHDYPAPGGALPPYPDAQITAVIALAREIMAHHDIPATGLVAHSDIAPARKIDPGEHFPWQRLAEAGLGLWPPVETGSACVWSGGDASRLNAHLAQIGYDTSDIPAALRAFQRRWMPTAITGLADADTLRRLAQIAEAYALGPVGSSSPQA
ncbi:N-acetylmuramoyl-L-alanine amidase [Hyphomonas neptunium ATCC 15444]|uniref:N-acetylmuramoyl-L-alanine amidase n=2 Tax=Hyphomonas TaxID=85 RepID=Q0C4Y3_HYPNA|nr:MULTISPECIES: N-acetylmuramoyl-L-alanine amidase [Hyphomonas]ABI78382.1 N-acetylmuramoyl-L-alanine amidase [Hyphomonas neptunium ATCC 15444]KCZ95642.1 N-acetylmuramoyl-L-alanine amidase [Hyphomonas hirschiana VP5]